MEVCDECGKIEPEGSMHYITDPDDGDYFLCGECWARERNIDAEET